MAVGDVNSTERGSGARFNDGKPPLELIPLRVLHAHYVRFYHTANMTRALAALEYLGQFQETGNRVALHNALEFLGPEALISAARVLDYGKRKYAEWNWAKGMKWSVCIGCAARHIVLGILAGEENDPESGELHAGHVACNIIFLLTYLDFYPEGDDLPRVFRPAEETKRAA